MKREIVSVKFKAHSLTLARAEPDFFKTLKLPDRSGNAPDQVPGVKLCDFLGCEITGVGQINTDDNGIAQLD